VDADEREIKGRRLDRLLFRAQGGKPGKGKEKEMNLMLDLMPDAQ
jgi:hypothetical protein